MLRRLTWDVVRAVGQPGDLELHPTEILLLEVVELAWDSQGLLLAAAGCWSCSCFLYQLSQPQTARVQTWWGPLVCRRG